MKIYGCLGFIAICLLAACQPKDHKVKSAVKTEHPDLQKDSVLEARKELDWFGVQGRFFGDCLHPYLVKKGIVPNCSTCDRFVFRYALSTDKNGKIKSIVKLGRRVVCNLSKKDLEELDTLIDIYLRKQILPVSLRNCTYKGSFISLLKC